MGRGKYLTQEQKLKIVTLNKSNWSLKAIAADIKKSKTAVKKFLNEYQPRKKMKNQKDSPNYQKLSIARFCAKLQKEKLRTGHSKRAEPPRIRSKMQAIALGRKAFEISENGNLNVNEAPQPSK